jgi:hypothetical protein
MFKVNFHGIDPKGVRPSWGAAAWEQLPAWKKSSATEQA